MIMKYDIVHIFDFGELELFLDKKTNTFYCVLFWWVENYFIELIKISF